MFLKRKGSVEKLTYFVAVLLRWTVTGFKGDCHDTTNKFSQALSAPKSNRNSQLYTFALETDTGR